MSSATKRAILRSIHLIFAIPIIGYVYSPFAELPNYAPIVRFVSIPVLILSSFWMYAGVFFAIIGEKEVDMFVNALDDVLTECRKFPGPMGELGNNFVRAALGSRKSAEPKPVSA